MKKIMIFISSQAILFWLISFTVFLTSGRGENWARFNLGLKYDSNELSPVLVTILITLLASCILLLKLYHYFISRWNTWMEKGIVSMDKSFIISIIPFFWIFSYLMDFYPFFPIFKFLSHIFTTWYGLPRMLTYSGIPCAVFFLISIFIQKIRQGYNRIAFSIIASIISIQLVGFTDRLVGGGSSGWMSYLNISDSSFHIYTAASASITYLVSIFILMPGSEKNKT